MIKENGHPLKMLCRMSSINIEKKILADLEEKARHDSLTGLFNKETFDQAARIAIQDVGFFVIFDIDHFKQINDTKGHLKGDEVLKEVAKITRDFFKDAIIGRVGGDEFAMYVSNNLNIEGFKDYFLTNISDSDVTISLGSCNTIHYEDYEAIYKKADELMYMAKNEPGFSFKVQ